MWKIVCSTSSLRFDTMTCGTTVRIKQFKQLSLPALCTNISKILRPYLLRYVVVELGLSGELMKSMRDHSTFMQLLGEAQATARTIRGV